MPHLSRLNSMRVSIISRSLRVVAWFATISSFVACGGDPATAPRPSEGTIAITSSESDVFVGDVFSVSAIVRDSAGHAVPGAAVTFTSADTSIALVSASGQVVTLREGTARIVARSGALSANLVLPVQHLVVSSVTILGLLDTLAAGDISVFGIRALGQGNRDVPGRDVKLASSNPAVAVIDPSGRVRAVTTGRTTISATVDGVAATQTVVVEGTSAEFHLRRSDGQTVPTLIERDSLAVGNTVQQFEIYLESGTLQLTGGSAPGYKTSLHYAWYDVTFDVDGRRRLVFKSAIDIEDNGAVRYDARGDLVMTSDRTADVAHAAGPETGGFTMRYETVPNPNVPTVSFFFRREPM